MQVTKALGSLFSATYGIASGAASAALSGAYSVLGTAVQLTGNIGVKVDVNGLIDQGFAFVESKSPAGIAPLEEIGKTALKNYLGQFV